jgi:hypothetical protein
MKKNYYFTQELLPMYRGFFCCWINASKYAFRVVQIVVILILCRKLRKRVNRNLKGSEFLKKKDFLKIRADIPIIILFYLIKRAHVIKEHFLKNQNSFLFKNMFFDVQLDGTTSDNHQIIA